MLETGKDGNPFGLQSLGADADIFEVVNITPDVEMRMLERGLVIKGLTTITDGSSEGAMLNMAIIPESPAGKFHQMVMSINTSDELKAKAWEDFYKDLSGEADEERFRSRWPELY